jgi:ABC-type multidrug transport system fused ATPase/permease subunit
MPSEAENANAAGAGPATPLGAWLSVLAPAYQGQMLGIVGLNVLAAAFTFIELQLLRSLTVVLSRAPEAAGAQCAVGQWFRSGFSLAAEPCGARLPFFLLVSYALATFAQSGVEIAAYALNSRLSQRARRDVERELLRNLLQQDDAFFIRRSPAEVMSRLGGDIQRAGGRRQMVTQGIASGLSVIATVAVLITQSWLAAAIGLAISAIGVVAAQPRLRKLRNLDRAAVAGDEQVKAAFEDTLQGVAEIQVSGLLGGVLNRFGRRQSARDVVALQNADVNNNNAVYQRMTFTLGFIAVLAMIVGTNLFRGAGASAAAPVEGGAAAAGLIVVLIATLPQLYFKFGELTQLLTQFQISEESILRLRQYEAPHSPVQPGGSQHDGPGEAGTIALRAVRYQFSGSDAVQGGADGVSCVIPARGMTAIVGPAGSGKSTLIKLILGRQKLLSGAVARPDAPQSGSLFVYLPQRPILFDATIGENLFLSAPEPGAEALIALAGSLGRLGLLDLVRLKGLDALPDESANRDVDFAPLRAGFRQAIETALKTPLNPLGRGRPGPRQMAIESQLACAADQAIIARRLTSSSGRPPVRALASLSYGRQMAPIATALIRQTAPLLTKSGSAEDYNRIATCAIAPDIFMLRASALDLVMGMSDGPPRGPPQPLLVAIALSARLEELGDLAPPEADEDALPHLQKLVAGISRPLDPAKINPLLPWRENLLFAAPDSENARRLAQADGVLLERLAATPLDAALIEAGLGYPVGRQGARLSGGQQQLIALGRALLTPAPFVVLDEPSSAFHPKLRQAAIAVLREEARSRSIIVVTHDFETARACDQALFVRDGALVGQGSWDTLLAKADGFAAWVAESKEAP